MGLTIPRNINASQITTGSIGSDYLPDGLNIDVSGRMTTPNQPAFAAYDNRGAGAMAVANLNISQYFTTAETNIGGCYNISNGRFTAPVSGFYIFGWNFFTTGVAATTTSRSGIHKNGESAGVISMGDQAAATSGHTVGIYLNANDYVNLGTQGGSYTAYWYSSSNHSRFWGYLVG